MKKEGLKYNYCNDISKMKKKKRKKRLGRGKKRDGE